MDRRDFLATLGAVSVTPLAGNFLVQNPDKLILPNNEIVLATTMPEESLGYVQYDWAEVKINWHPERFQTFRDPFPQYIGLGFAEITVHGYANIKDVNREAKWFNETDRQNGLKLYFAKVA